MVNKIVFVGNHEYGYNILDHLLSNGIKISHIVSLNEEQVETSNLSGHHSFLAISKKYSIPIYFPKTFSLKDKLDTDFFIDNKFDLMIVAGWQRLIPSEVLNTLNIFGLGLHGSSDFLPKGRGRSPVNWSIIEGKKQFILHLFILKPDADDGDILDFFKFDINDWDNCRTLYYKISVVANKLLLKNIPKIFEKNFEQITQKGDPTYYPKRTPKDGLINWNCTSKEIYNFVRAITKPYPGAFTYNKKNKIFIWTAQPFDSKIIYPDAKYGEVVEKFTSGDFLVQCSSDLLLVTEYEGIVSVGDTLGV